MLDKKNIIMLSALDVWSLGTKKGAQSLYKTLQSLSEEFNIEYFTNAKISEHSKLELPAIKFNSMNFLSIEKTFNPTNKLHSFRLFLFPLWWVLFQIKSFFSIKTLIKHKKISVLYAYEVSAVPVMKVLSKLYNIPLVTRFQGTILHPLLSKPFTRILKFYHYIALKISANLLIMTNDGTKGDVVLKRLNNKSTKINFWYNGVTPPKIPNKEEITKKKKELSIPSESKTLLTVSRLVYWKRVDRSITALQETHNELIHLIIVGDGPDRPRLESLAGKSRNIHFVGAISHENIGTYYAMCDIFMSLYSLSNVGNPLLEAMTLGKPIITLNNGDTSKIIKHMNNGLIIDETRLGLIPGQINKLISEEKIRLELGQQAQSSAKENFWDWPERMNAEIKSIYEIITESQKQKPHQESQKQD